MIPEIAQQQINYISQRCKEIKPLVAIHCLSYNHEKYLRDALESFIMQKTNFSFVAIIHDDVSTDKTTDIIKEYARNYPDIIFPIFEKENQYSKPDGSLTQIMNEACFATGAKYIAMCEGDDYWIDPLKLQKQVNFLKSNPEFSLCFSRAKVIAESSDISTDIYDHLKEKIYYPDEIIRKWTIPTASTLIRIEVFRNIPFHPDFCVGDNVLFLTAASLGKIYCLKDITSVYRRQSDGWYMRTDKNEITRKMLFHYKALEDTFSNIKLPSLKKNISRNCAKIFLSKNQFNKEIFKIGINTSFIKFIEYIIYFKVKNFKKGIH